MLDRQRLERLLDALGRAARTPGDVFLTGGACAVTYGWRGSTVDVDLRLDPEPSGLFEAIPRLKDQLDVNIELASPADFVPALPGWRELFDQVRGELVRYPAIDPDDLDAKVRALVEGAGGG